MSIATADGGFFAKVYDELRRLAAVRMTGEAAGHSLDATALVHEAYLRLEDAAFADRSGFFRAASATMQRILVDHARKKRADKRGGGTRPVDLEEVSGFLDATPDLLLDVDEAITKLAACDPSSAEVARHRLFAGLSIEEAAEAMGVSRATAFREWAYARSWLATALESAR